MCVHMCGHTHTHIQVSKHGKEIMLILLHKVSLMVKCVPDPIF